MTTCLSSIYFTRLTYLLTYNNNNNITHRYGLGLVLTSECKKYNYVISENDVADGSSGSCDSVLVVVTIYISIFLIAISLWRRFKYYAFEFGLSLLLFVLHRPRNIIFLLSLYVCVCVCVSCSLNTSPPDPHTESHPLTHSLTYTLRYGTTTHLTLYLKEQHTTRWYWVPLALGRCGFFALGNSHLISTIDIAGAYTGVSSFSVVVPILLWIISETGPIVGLVMFFRIVVMLNNNLSRALEFISIACISSTLINAAVLLYMRHHLFIWSVFAPRFCYEVAYLLTNTVVCTVVSLMAI